MSRTLLLGLTFAFLWVAPSRARAQAPEDLPEEYAASLTAALAESDAEAFVEAVRPLLEDARSQLSTEQEEAVLATIGERSKVLLLNETNLSTASEDTLWSLVAWSGSLLTAEERSYASGLIASRPSIVGLPYEDMIKRLDTRSSLEVAGYEAEEAPRVALASWLREADVSTLEEQQLYECLRRVEPRADYVDGYEIEWTGSVTAPRTGEYTFSASPLNINTRYGDAYHHQYMIVDVGGQRVLDTSQGPAVEEGAPGWQDRGAPVRLTGGEQTPIKVNLRYEFEGGYSRVSVAALYWEGPGVSKQLTPPSAFTPPSGEGEGLLATATWRERPTEDQPPVERTLSQQTPQVDHVFRRSLLCSYPDVFEDLVATHLERLTSPAALEALTVPPQEGEAGRQEIHHFFRRGLRMMLLQYASSATRADMANRLLDEPQVFAEAHFSMVHPCYNLIRIGAEDEAMSLLGAWMTANADWTPELVGGYDDFFNRNRKPFRHATIALVWERPGSAASLEEGFLKTEAGGCVLPTAYTVAYAYLVQGQIAAWVAKLDQILEEDAPTGDARVNWLLARAMAEEISESPASRHQLGHEQLRAGWKWLEEARATAETPETKDRVLREQLARLLATQDVQGVRELLSSQSGAPAALQARVDELIEETEQQRAASRAAITDAYIAELESRKQRATDAGDSAATERYARLISGLQSGADAEPSSE